MCSINLTNKFYEKNIILNLIKINSLIVAITNPLTIAYGLYSLGLYRLIVSAMLSA